MTSPRSSHASAESPRRQPAGRTSIAAIIKIELQNQFRCIKDMTPLAAAIYRIRKAVQSGFDALRHGERFEQHIIEASPSVIYIYDVRQRKNVFINRSLAAAL